MRFTTFLTLFTLLLATLAWPAPIQSTTELVPPQADEARLGQLAQEVTMDAAWCEGRVHLPAGTPAEESITILARNYSWPGDGEYYRTQAAADGSFRIPFPEGTRQAWVSLEGRFVQLPKVHVSWGGEETNPLELRPELAVSWQIDVRQADGQPLADAEIRTYRMPNSPFAFQLPSSGPGQFELALAPGQSKVLYVELPEGGCIVQGVPSKEKPGPQSLTIQVEPPSRLRGQFVWPEGYHPGSLLIEATRVPGSGKKPKPDGSDYDFLTHTAFPLPIGLDKGLARYFHYESLDGSFDLTVPYGHTIYLHIRCADGSEVGHTEPALKPGEIRDQLRIEIDPGDLMFGRVVDQAGQPISNASVLGLASWADSNDFRDAFGAYAWSTARAQSGKSPLAIGPPDSRWPATWSGLQANPSDYQHFTTTDAQGRFAFRVHERIQTVPLAVIAGCPEGVLPETWGFEAEQQHFPAVPVTKAGVTLRLTPQTGRLHGRVRGAQGQPLTDYTLTLAPQGYRPELHPYPQDPSLSAEFQETIADSNNPQITWSEWEASPHSYYMPANDADVYMYGPPYQPKYVYPIIAADDGKFALDNLPSGRWSVTIDAPGYHPQTKEDIPVPIAVPLDILLEAPARVVCTVRNAQGNPLRNVGLQIRPAREKPTGFWPAQDSGTQTDANGQLEWTSLAPGNYRVSVLGQWYGLIDEQLLTLAAGDDQQLDFQAAHTGQLSAKILWNAEPYPVAMQLHSGRTAASTLSKSITTQTHDFGTLRAGPYTLRFYPEGLDGKESDAFPSQSVTVQPNVTSTVEIRPSAGFCQAQGRVLVNGSVVKQGVLMLRESDTQKWLPRIPIDDQGRYQSPFPHAGEYLVYYSPDGEYKQSRKQADPAIGRQVFTFGPGKSASMDLNFQTTTASVRLVDSSGNPVPVPESIRDRFTLVEADVDAGPKISCVGVWNTGEIVFRGIPAGRYRLHLSSNGQPFPYHLATSTSVQVTESPLAAFEVICNPQGSLHGVLNASGFLDGDRILVHAWADPEHTQKLRTTAAYAGTRIEYHLNDLPLGPVYLTTSIPRFQLGVLQANIEVDLGSETLKFAEQPVPERNVDFATQR